MLYSLPSPLLRLSSNPHELGVWPKPSEPLILNPPLAIPMDMELGPLGALVRTTIRLHEALAAATLLGNVGTRKREVG